MMENLQNLNMEARSANDDKEDYGQNQLFDMNLQIEDIEAGPVFL